MKFDIYKEKEFVARIRIESVGIPIHSINITKTQVHPQAKVIVKDDRPHFVFDIPAGVYCAEKTARQFTCELRTNILSVVARADMDVPENLVSYKPLFLFMLANGFKAKTAYEVVESDNFIVRTRLDCDGVHHFSIPRDLLVAHDALLEGLMLANMGVDCAQ